MVSAETSGMARSRHDLESVTDVAVRVFLERGYDGTSMADIARAAGIQKATLYHHVTSKEDLLLRGVSRVLDAYGAMLDEPGAAVDREPVERLRYMVRRTCELITGLVPETALLIRARGNTKTERWALEQRRQINVVFADLLTAASEARGTRPAADGFDLTARLVLGMITSTVDWYRDSGDVSSRRVADIVESIVFGGVFAEG